MNLIWFDFNIYEIFWVAVNSSFQGRVVGKRIIDDIVKRIAFFKGHLKARVIILSTRSPKFFVKCGFKKISALPGDGGFLMTMEL